MEANLLFDLFSYILADDMTHLDTSYVCEFGYDRMRGGVGENLRFSIEGFSSAEASTFVVQKISKICFHNSYKFSWLCRVERVSVGAPIFFKHKVWILWDAVFIHTRL